MSGAWIDMETGEEVSRIQIIKDFEEHTGIELTAEGVQTLLDELTKVQQERTGGSESV